MERLNINILQVGEIKSIDNQDVSQRSRCSAWKNGTLAIATEGERTAFQALRKSERLIIN